MKKKTSRAVVGYLFLVPFLVIFSVFYATPLFYAGYLSLFVQRGLLTRIYVGLQNYIGVFSDAQFLGSLANIGKFFIIQAPAMLGLAVLFALYLDRRENPLRRLFRVVYYLPFTVSTVVAGLMWGYLFSKTMSPFNIVASLFGVTPDFFGHVLPLVGVIMTWELTGYNMVIMYAALQSVPPELYDAAKVDGAGNLQVIWYIKLPVLLPAVILTLIFTIIQTSQIFNEPYVLSTFAYVAPNLTPNLYIYNTAFRYGRFGYAGAMAIVLAVITFAVSFIFIRYNRLEER
jgi:multiple sugar transport system permease protein